MPKSMSPQRFNRTHRSKAGLAERERLLGPPPRRIFPPVLAQSLHYDGGESRERADYLRRREREALGLPCEGKPIVGTVSAAEAPDGEHKIGSYYGSSTATFNRMVRNPGKEKNSRALAPHGSRKKGGATWERKVQPPNEKALQRRRKSR